MVAILLAIYNGYDRLPILINSIINQSYKDWRLYIHDDGSTDNSLQICKEIQSQDYRIVILSDNIKHRGAKNSFMWLLGKVQADYYMFCDQDDLWLPFKIEQSINRIKKIEADSSVNIPVCVHTDLAVVDGFYNITAQSLWKRSKIVPDLLETKDYIQVFNCVTGCTMIFNEKAKSVSLPFNKIAPMHDFWVAYRTIITGGTLTHLKASTILYCQHGTNEIGAINVNGSYILNKLRHIRKVIENNRHNFHIMHEISGISFFKYLWCKIVYNFRRCFIL